jgi:hypothetical protein
MTMMQPALRDAGIAGLLAILCACAFAQTRAEPATAIPPRLQAPAGQTLVLAARAQGVQIYVCGVDKNDATQWHWIFKAPEAELFDAQGEKIGTHYAGPTWEALDGSRVVGEVVARDDGPDPGAIPWLLLASKMRSGNGELENVQSIQRVLTVGGKPPATGCSKEHEGETARSPYAATYYFYTSAPEGGVVR